MGARTRSSAASSPVKSKAPTKVLLASAEEDPYTIFVLPSDTSKDARFVLLKNPRDSERRRYYFCPSKGLYEMTKICADTYDLRSVMFAPEEEPTTTSEAMSMQNEMEPATVESGGAADVKDTPLKGASFEGYINKSAQLLVATPFDPIFILLPLLDPPTTTSRTQPGEGLFRPFDDILDEQLQEDSHLRHVLTDRAFRPTLLRALGDICDIVDAGDEQMYRLSMPKLSEYLLIKAQRVVAHGLPASLEERFVTRSLEVPMLSVKRQESDVTSASKENDVTLGCLDPDMGNSQSSVASTTTTPAASSATSSATSDGMFDDVPPASLQYLQRLRTAISFITASYLDPARAAKLAVMSAEGKASSDFGPLNKHLQQLAKLRAEESASRSLSDFSKKRNIEDEEAAEERAEKKRKQEDEEKKKKSQESRGVRDLKKANVSGMKKMSDFFAKKGPTGKSKA
jgi:Ydr279p protein family (RNase H2 complex component) wHTH domain/Ydr279p protein triple barrel domain